MADRTNFAFVYVTKEFREGFRMYTTEPKKQKTGEWTDIFGRRHLANDITELVEAQVFGGNNITKEDKEATPCIIVPVRMMEGVEDIYNEEDMQDKQTFNFRTDKNTVKIASAMANEVGKHSSDLSRQVYNSRTQIDRIPMIMSTINIAVNNQTALTTALRDAVNEIQSIVKELHQKKKRMDATDVIDPEKKTPEDYAHYADKHLQELLVKAKNLVENFHTKLHEGTDALVEAAGAIEGSINDLDRVSHDINKTFHEFRNQLTSGAAGEEVMRMYSRMEWLNKEHNKNRRVIAEQSATIANYDTMNIALTHENIALKEGMAEWMQQEHPEEYKKIYHYITCKEDIERQDSKNKRNAEAMADAMKAMVEDIKHLSHSYKKNADLLEDAKKKNKEVGEIISQVLLANDADAHKVKMPNYEVEKKKESADADE